MKRDCWGALIVVGLLTPPLTALLLLAGQPVNYQLPQSMPYWVGNTSPSNHGLPLDPEFPELRTTFTTPASGTMIGHFVSVPSTAGTPAEFVCPWHEQSIIHAADSNLATAFRSQSWIDLARAQTAPALTIASLLGWQPTHFG